MNPKNCNLILPSEVVEQLKLAKENASETYGNLLRRLLKNANKN